ncbi:MAG: hypothetical protein HGB32_09970 [Geobacteraceae bacterium]|nr:hypothetical protein [Geobacteraceae bacterium]NTW80460.1 hypothetical protein [Geobacteraceae bacterium]
MESTHLEGQSGNSITHGICARCKDKILGPEKIELMTFLDSLNMPIVLVDAMGMAETANKAARKILKKELPEIVGFAGGVIFECAYSILPEGCGKTIHCSGCTIRNTVMDTFQSGNSHLEIKALLNQGTSDKNEEVFYLISTEKAGDVVLLKIDTADNA